MLDKTCIFILYLFSLLFLLRMPDKICLFILNLFSLLLLLRMPINTYLCIWYLFACLYEYQLLYVYLSVIYSLISMNANYTCLFICISPRTQEVPSRWQLCLLQLMEGLSDQPWARKLEDQGSTTDRPNTGSHPQPIMCQLKASGRQQAWAQANDDPRH